MNRPENSYTRPYLQKPKHGKYLRAMGDHRYCFWCPACQSYHVITIDYPGVPDSDSWHSWDHMSDQFTVEPSVLVSTRRPKKDPEGNNLKDEAGNYLWNDIALCHLNITEGNIIYHPDSPHAMAGQKVPLTEEPE